MKELTNICLRHKLIYGFSFANVHTLDSRALIKRNTRRFIHEIIRREMKRGGKRSGRKWERNFNKTENPTLNCVSCMLPDHCWISVLCLCHYYYQLYLFMHYFYKNFIWITASIVFPTRFSLLLMITNIFFSVFGSFVSLLIKFILLQFSDLSTLAFTVVGCCL